MRPPIPLFWILLAGVLPASSNEPTTLVSAEGRGRPALSLEDGRESPLRNAALERRLLALRAKPAGVATGDFDGDGLDDLVVGYRLSEGGILVLYPANPVSIFPNSEVAATLRPDAAGADVPLLAPKEIVPLQDSPDLVAVGDFDADGRREIVAAGIGRSQLTWISGDGSGGVETVSTIELPGRVTTIAAGEFHRADGATDLLVGVTSGERSSLWIYPSQAVPLPGEPSRIELGRFDDDLGFDAAVLAGGEVVVVSRKEQALISISLPLDFDVRSIAAGRFDPGSHRRDGIVALSAEGLLRIVRFENGAWEAHDPDVEFASPLPPEGRLLRMKVSAAAGHDVAILDPAERRLILPGLKGAVLDVRDEPVAVRQLRLNGDSFDDLVFVVRRRFAPVVVETAPLAVFTVNSTLDTSDATPGDGVCADGFIVPRCTLRAAMEEAQAGGGPHTIEFDLGAGTPKIPIATDLPGVSDVTVDGATGNATRVEILGAGGGNGFYLGSYNLIRSMIVNGFSRAVSLSTGASWQNRVEDCYIGLNSAGGTAGAGNQIGIEMIQFPESNTIGGTTIAQRNVISNQSGYGISLGTETISNEILGNYIGTDPTGTLARPNESGGIHSLGDSSDSFGAASVTPGQPPGNVISGNDGSGIVAFGAPWGYIRSNLIGTDAEGEVALPNAVGVSILDGYNGLLVGNVVSGNDGDGVRVCASAGGGWPSPCGRNLIGTDIAGSSPLPNRGDGVEITCGWTDFGSLTGATPGGCTGDCNVIAFNEGAGVRVRSADDESAIVGNSIHDNGGLGIDLDPPGPNPNDLLDADSGANQQQNHPLLTFADFDGVDTAIAGTLHSMPSTTFSIDVYGNAVADPDDAEGGSWFGRTSVTTDNSGNGSFALVVPGSTGYPTATATDPEDNTSEFSPGYSNPGEAGGLLASKGAGSSVAVTWSPACSASDHAIYLGSAAGPPVWTDAFCGLGITGAAAFDPGDPNPGRFFYFVIVGQGVGSEGSYGRGSAGDERQEATGIGACDLPRALTMVCP